MVGIPATFGSLAIIFVLLRVYARVFINKFFAWDDRFIILALVTTSQPHLEKASLTLREIDFCFTIEFPSLSKYVSTQGDIQAEISSINSLLQWPELAWERIYGRYLSTI